MVYIKLAIFSPNQNAYSETFIQAHRNLPFDMKYYYGGHLPYACEDDPHMLQLSWKERLKKKLLKGFSYEEKKLLFSLRKLRVQAVLAEYGPTAVECLRVVKYLRLPMVVHFHGFDASDKGTIEKYRERYKEVFSYASAVIVVSVKMRETLLSFGCPADKLFLNYYGPNPSFFECSPAFTKTQFIAVGRFAPKKAPHLTIKSFKKVTEVFPDAKLVMIGDGPLFETCVDLANSLHLQNNIVFKGACNPQEIRKELQNAIAFVQHSVIAESGDSEGTPVAVLEAQAAGLPVISTFHAGIPDVVINNETGFLVEENDVDGMAERMIKLLEEDGVAKKMGEAGRKRILENFTMERHLKTIDTLIKESLNS